jgi:hypothetical protein
MGGIRMHAQPVNFGADAGVAAAFQYLEIMVDVLVISFHSAGQGSHANLSDLGTT